MVQYKNNIEALFKNPSDISNNILSTHYGKRHTHERVYPNKKTIF